MNKNNEQAKVLTDKELEGVSGGIIHMGQALDIRVKSAGIRYAEKYSRNKIVVGKIRP